MRRAGGKILTVHSVRAATAVLDLIETCLPPSRGGVVLHWFTGTAAEARRAIDLGCYFSINAEMLRKDHLRTVVTMLPLDRVLTETDGPFTQHDRRPAKPADVAAVVDEFARLRGMEVGAAISAIWANLRCLVFAHQ